MPCGVNMNVKNVESLENKLNEPIVIQIGSSVEKTNANQEGSDFAAEINGETIAAYLKMKFSDREHEENRKLLSLLLSDLNSRGITNCDQLEKIVNDNLKWFGGFEKDNPPLDTPNRRFSDIGVIRIILSVRMLPSYDLKDCKNQEQPK